LVPGAFASFREGSLSREERLARNRVLRNE
jgi:hypothetical protein